MKIFLSRKVGLVVAIVVFSSAGSAYAQQGAKGGGLQLMELSGKRATAMASESVALKAPTCPLCKFERKIVVVRDNRGRVVRPVPTVSHTCPTCKTTSVLTGHGKGKVEKHIHTCTTVAANALCCAR